MLSGRIAWEQILADPRDLKEAREVLQHSPRIGIAGKAQHEGSQRIEEIDVSRRVSRRRELREKGSARRTQDVQALVLAQQSGGWDRKVVDKPHPLDSFGVPAQRKTHLAHVRELFPADTAAGPGIDLEQHPLAPHLRKPERTAVDATQLGIGE